MDDPGLSWQAKASAMPLVRHANLDGKRCHPGAKRCAAEMSLSERTITRGWAELKTAGYLAIMPLPANRRRTHGATKVFKFPTWSPVDLKSSGLEVHGGTELTSNGPPTFEGNREDPSDPSGPCEDCGAPSVTHNFGADLCPECAEKRWKGER